MRQWLDARTAPEMPVLATDSQATAYALDRPVVGMPGSDFAETFWDEAEVVRTMDRFGARFLVLYVDQRDGGVPADESPVVADALAGRSSVALPVAARSAEVIVLERDRTP